MIAIGLQASDRGRATRGGRFAAPIRDATGLKVGEPGGNRLRVCETDPGGAVNPGGKNGGAAARLGAWPLPGADETKEKGTQINRSFGVGSLKVVKDIGAKKR